MDSGNNVLFKNIYLEGKYEDLLIFSDVELSTKDGWTFKVHRVVLAVKNNYFRKLFIHGRNRNTIQIPGITGRILDQVLYYIYTKSLDIKYEDISELLIAADYFGEESLVRQTQTYAMENVSIKNCFPIYIASLKIGDMELQNVSYRYIQVNFQTLIVNQLVDLDEISLEVLKHILQDDLFIKGEEIVWLCIEKWVMVDFLNRLPNIPDLLKCLKVADIEDSLANEIIHSNIVYENPLFKHLIKTEELDQSQNSLDMLKCIIQNSSDLLNPTYDFQSHRYSRCLHLFLYTDRDYEPEIEFPKVTLYITFDDKVDFWQKLTDTRIEEPIFLTVIGHKIYVFSYYFSENMIFDICDKQWIPMVSPQVECKDYVVIALGDKIFILGGHSVENYKPVMSVEFYDTVMGTWFNAMPMMPIYKFQAVSYQNKICVVGHSCDDYNSPVVAQIYDPHLNLWSFFKSPNSFRKRFTFDLIEYHGKLYIVSMAEDKPFCRVEVFDFVSETWDFITDVPDFHLIKAIVFNDQFILHEYIVRDSKAQFAPVLLNEEESSWEPLNDHWMFLKNFDRLCYDLCSIDSDNEIKEMQKMIRDPSSNFQKSPFY